MLRPLSTAFVICLVAAQAWAEPPSPRQAAFAALRQEARSLREVGQVGLRPGQRARLRACLVSRFPAVDPPRALGADERKEQRDPTFRGQHPMFQRLLASGWYRDTATIGRLQGLASNLRATRALPPTTPLDQLETLAFDLEASGGMAGHFDKRRGVLSGWDEITQFGYTVYRGQTKISSGTIAIKPDVTIPRIVQRITHLSPERLASAPRFEQAAEQILKLMQGRVLVGQGSLGNDWSWLQSNFARLGVDLPGPRSLMLDTHVLSFHHYPAGAGLKELSRRYNVDAGQRHDAGCDAAATGAVLQAMLREQNARTLGDAFQLLERGEQLKHAPH